MVSSRPELQSAESVSLLDLVEAWPLLTMEDRLESFRELDRPTAEDLFLRISTRDQADLLQGLPPGERRSWLRMLAPDDAVDLIQEIPGEVREELLALLDDPTRKEVTGLLAYAEDDAGGLMSTRYARVRPDMSVDEAITYLKKQTREKVEMVHYVYVLDQEQRLLGVVSYRDLFSARADRKINEIMRTQLTTVLEDTDQEQVGRLFGTSRLTAIPVLNEAGQMMGVVTLDDIVEVVQEEATEDIQKIGGTQALDAPYLQVSLPEMIRKRAGWLMVLFVGEMLTATAMGRYEAEIARAVVLALFVPMIISSGGNSGSQATTLVIRAMALGEVRLKDWWRVVRREFVSGLGLGAILGAIGVLRIVSWQAMFHTYGDHSTVIAMTVGISLLAVVLWGTIAGSMLPFVLRRLGFDPASASAPFVATLVDVTGLVIYFSTAQVLMRGTLL